MKEVNNKRKHVLGKAQYHLKVSDIKKLLSTLHVLTISAIPTWRTQWKASLLLLRSLLLSFLLLSPLVPLLPLLLLLLSLLLSLLLAP